MPRLGRGGLRLLLCVLRVRLDVHRLRLAQDVGSRGDVALGLVPGGLEGAEGDREHGACVVGERAHRGPLPEAQPVRGLLGQGTVGQAGAELGVETRGGRVGTGVQQASDEVGPDVSGRTPGVTCPDLSTSGG